VILHTNNTLAQRCDLQSLDDCAPETLFANQTNYIYSGLNIANRNNRCYDPDVEYFFQVQPAVGKNNDTDEVKLWLHMSGGGFCHSAEGCQENPIVANKPQPRGNGIYEAETDDRYSSNPAKGFTRIGLLYCSGDAHLGNAFASSDDTVEWRGRDNTVTVLEWVHKHYPNPTHVVISGCSAGSLGMMYWTHAIRSTYYPNVSAFTVIYDSWMGIDEHPTKSKTKTAAQEWGLCHDDTLATLKMDSDMDQQVCLEEQFTPNMSNPLRMSVTSMTMLPLSTSTTRTTLGNATCRVVPVPNQIFIKSKKICCIAIALLIAITLRTPSPTTTTSLVTGLTRGAIASWTGEACTIL
jgi:Pectinacetylesterase